MTAPDAAGVFAGVTRRMLQEHPEDETGRMLQSPGLRTGGRFYAFVTGDDIVVKLPADQVAALITADEGQPCSPRPGRPMREWVRIPVSDEASCLARVRAARAFVLAQQGSS